MSILTSFPTCEHFRIFRDASLMFPIKHRSQNMFHTTRQCVILFKVINSRNSQVISNGSCSINPDHDSSCYQTKSFRSDLGSIQFGSGLPNRDRIYLMELVDNAVPPRNSMNRWDIPDSQLKHTWIFRSDLLAENINMSSFHNTRNFEDIILN